MLDDRGAGLDGGEDVGLGDHVGDLIAAPAVALDADPPGIDEALVDDLLDGRQDALQGARPRVAGLVDDVGLEEDVAVADVAG